MIAHLGIQNIAMPSGGGPYTGYCPTNSAMNIVGKLYEIHGHGGYANGQIRPFESHQEAHGVVVGYLKWKSVGHPADSEAYYHRGIKVLQQGAKLAAGDVVTCWESSFNFANGIVQGWFFTNEGLIVQIEEFAPGGGVYGYTILDVLNGKNAVGYVSGGSSGAGFVQISAATFFYVAASFICRLRDASGAVVFQSTLTETPSYGGVTLNFDYVTLPAGGYTPSVTTYDGIEVFGATFPFTP